MTMLASWVGVDTHGPTSVYIVSDSRFSWGNNQFFDYGKKVFASNVYPEIFGYAGDVLFPSIVLSQIIEMIDLGLLLNKTMNCEEKNKCIYERLRWAFSCYPNVLGNNPIQIIHMSRDTEFDKYPRFFQFYMTWDKKNGWKKRKKDIPLESGLLCVLGSGAEDFKSNYDKRYQQGRNRSTSRNIFHCFIDTLMNSKNSECGGPPQLVGIYRKPDSSAVNYGIIYNHRRFLLGMGVPGKRFLNNIEWRNKNFEISNGKTKKRKVGSAKQPDPLRRE